VVGGTNYLWEGETMGHTATNSHVQTKKMKRKGSSYTQVVSPKTELERATSLIQSVTRVYHWSSKDYKIDVESVLETTKDLWPLVGGKDVVRRNITVFRTRLRTYFHEHSEIFMKNYNTAISDADLVAHILSTLYANAVDIFSNQRAINIAETYVSSYNKISSTKQQLRRKEIDKEIFACKEQYELEPLDVPLYEHFDAPRRQKTEASLRLNSSILDEEDYDQTCGDNGET
jgi:hypothetical protein